MEWLTDNLKKAEDLLQAVDQSVAKQMNEGGSLGADLFGALSAGTSVQTDRQTSEKRVEDRVDDPVQDRVDGRLAGTEECGAPPSGPSGRTNPAITRRASSTSTKIELLKKKKRLERRRQELMEKKREKEREKERGRAGQTVEVEEQVEGRERAVEEEGQEEEAEQQSAEQQQEQQQAVVADPRDHERHRQQQPRPPVTEGDTPSSSTSAPGDGGGYTHEDADRLARLVEALRKKNRGLDKEVLHLEDELTDVEKKNRELEDELSRLKGELQGAQTLGSRLETATADLESNEEIIRDLRQALERKERESAALTAERNVSETHLLTSLRKDVDAAEMVAENERRAHAKLRKTFEARETQLEEAVARATAALADSQAVLDEYAAKLAESQSHRTALEVQLAEVRKAAPATDATAGPETSEKRKERERSERDGARARELEEELSSALKDAAGAKNELSALEQDVARLRDESARHKQRIAQLETSDATTLQRRVNELTSVLYAKQTQIEQLSAEKSALVMQSQSDGVRRRSAAVDRLFAGGDADDVVPTRSLRAVDTLAGFKAVEGWVEGFARMLDGLAQQAVVLIRGSPLFRLGFLIYLVGLHALVYMVMYWGTSTHSQVRSVVA